MTFTYNIETSNFMGFTNKNLYDFLSVMLCSSLKVMAEALTSGLGSGKVQMTTMPKKVWIYNTMYLTTLEMQKY